MVDVCEIAPINIRGKHEINISVQTAINKAINWLDIQQPDGALVGSRGVHINSRYYTVNVSPLNGDFNKSIITVTHLNKKPKKPFNKRQIKSFIDALGEENIEDIVNGEGFYRVKFIIEKTPNESLNKALAVHNSLSTVGKSYKEKLEKGTELLIQP